MCLIGKIEDLMIDSKGHVPFAVMSFGGFLGMGEKDFAVPWTAMRFDREGNDVKALLVMSSSSGQRIHAWSES